MVVLYGFLDLKTTEWGIISRLGFKLETPLGYLQKPSQYHNTCRFLFLITICVPFFSKSVPLWGVVLVILEQFLVTAKGRANAIKTYRNIMQEMVNDDTNDTPKEAGAEILYRLNYIDNILKKTDTEIWNDLIVREKLIKNT